MKELRCYYDFSCPWSYLSLVRLQDAADRNAPARPLPPAPLHKPLHNANPADFKHFITDRVPGPAVPWTDGVELVLMTVPDIRYLLPVFLGQYAPNFRGSPTLS